MFASLRLIVALAIGMGVAVAASTWLQQAPRNLAQARRWAIHGPRCPALAAGDFADLAVKPAASFQYDDVTFERGYGHVYCDEIHDDGGRGPGVHPVCQFTGPAVLKVTSPKGRFYFFPSTGRATVEVQRGVATCVRGGWFTGGEGQW